MHSCSESACHPKDSAWNKFLMLSCAVLCIAAAASKMGRMYFFIVIIAKTYLQLPNAAKVRFLKWWLFENLLVSALK
jgi:hypothetical protein